MNERIQELKDQCWVEKRWVYDQDNGMWIDKHIDMEKFAELIVRECADLFDDDPESGTRYTGVACRGLIKHYFGVEE